MSPCGSTLEEKLSSIMDALAKAAASEMSQLFSEGSATLRLQITRSLKEKEVLRTRMKVMRRELFSLRLQNRSNASRVASRLALTRANICRPKTEPLGNEDCDDFGDRSAQHGTTSESLHVDAPGSSHMSNPREELRILSVHGKGEGPLAVDGHDTLLTASEVEALSSLSVDHSVAKSLESGEQLVHREELTVQQTPDTMLIKEEEDIGGGMPAVENCDFGDRSTQHSDTSESLHVDAPGSSHMSSHSEELRILSVHGKGEGPLAVDGHGTLLIASKLKALNSLSGDHSVAKSQERSESLVRLELLTWHRGGRNGQPCVSLGKGFPDNTKLTIHRSTHNGEKPYGCGQCTKRFGQRVHLKLHMRTHTGEKPYSCDQCMKSFGRSSDRTVHMRTHSGEKPYRCDQCTKCFGQLTHLKVHMRTHTGEKPYSCDQCTKSFGRSSDLKVHMRTHSGEKPYRCDQCPKLFTTSSYLKVHMRTHSGEKPYRCDQCTKSFRQSSYLKLHMRTHSGEKPYWCDQCMKLFTTSSCLKVHMRTHSGEKPYSCDQCMKLFRTSSYLKFHMRTHSGEKPHRCSQCMKSFGQSSYLKLHMRTHSREKP